MSSRKPSWLSLVRKVDSFYGAYRFLSNFSPAEVVDDYSISYPTVEHAYQAAKTLNSTERLAIAQWQSPGQAKRYARAWVTIRPDWDSVKIDVMRGFLQQKFAKGTALAEKLLATGDRELVEGNTWGDTFWGQCRGRGENRLGRLLMEIRESLK